ncbi:pyrroloquinoline quinone biosynthesis peptide chaperone PqqD [Acidisoma cellulosilytica]|uniref:Pyrroloquinoline quinone biosynthesis peptide chaperone PqqD n=1 Tax=Acidisoma cellulosilyticum TaxID=2802395 RepID=A0A964E223_9PROT|nr:pyrroloquinoline quinone biosynthesis peptide chaperone PqqD [Acidisoma cellulosilyticum]MCB8878834.1 pyrroloquinoline quinone biosynthesis peptide chaperone PqqD [Acidisoma cellulosilyticum]
MTITPDSVPAFPRGIKYRFDAARAVWVLLTPERAMMPDENAQAVLSGIDGERTIAGIVADLADRYQAPTDVIMADVLELLTDLAGRGIITDRNAS